MIIIPSIVSDEISYFEEDLLATAEEAAAAAVEDLEDTFILNPELDHWVLTTQSTSTAGKFPQSSQLCVHFTFSQSRASSVWVSSLTDGFFIKKTLHS